MPTANTSTSARVWTAAELMQLAAQERDAILAAAAERAEEVYGTDQELTAFEAYGEEDLHVRSSDTEPRRNLDGQL